jgi:3-deoxy-D-manno-octulosonic-acid transferase
VRRPLQFGYDLVAGLARTAAHIAPDGDSKLLQGLRRRRGIIDRYRAWGSANRDLKRPLLWMHAPSVGEGLQARPVLQRVRERRPATQLAYTHFSPSAESFTARLDVDFRDYLVLDSSHDAEAAIEALRPTALVFSKLDVWPNIAAAAERHGARLGLISATLAESSGRRSRIARALLRDAYASLDAVGAIDAGDADRLAALGVRSSVISVTGDTRYDQVWERATSTSPNQTLVDSLANRRPTIVAGSTWPADEAVLLSAFSQLRRATPELRLIIAPHEPTAAHLEPIAAWATGTGAKVARTSDAEAAAADVMIVDTVGVLGDLYSLASVAYVGGGFHAAGLHSVLEPAAFGAPVIFGPRYEMSRDAKLLLANGGGASVTDERTFVTTVARWIKDPPRREECGAMARQLVKDGLGAAERAYGLVTELLDRTG